MAQKTKYAWVLKYYTDAGWRVGVVERTYKIEGKAQTFDLFTFGDIFGYRRKNYVIIQVTTDPNHGTHMTAMLRNPDVEEWLRDNPGRNHVHLISEHTRSKSKKGQLRIDEITPANFG